MSNATATRTPPNWTLIIILVGVSVASVFTSFSLLVAAVVIH
jgi:hypothetical protein